MSQVKVEPLSYRFSSLPLDFCRIVVIVNLTAVCCLQFAVEYGVKFMETSAKANVNVEDAFVTLARDIKVKMDKKLVCHVCVVML